jgi:hypothetical protein
MTHVLLMISLFIIWPLILIFSFPAAGLVTFVDQILVIAPVS